MDNIYYIYRYMYFYLKKKIDKIYNEFMIENSVN